MKTPTTLNGYLKMLIQIASDSSYDLKGKGIKDQDDINEGAFSQVRTTQNNPARSRTSTVSQAKINK